MSTLSIQKKDFLSKIQQGQFDQALLLANDVSQKEPDSPIGYTMLGDALMHKGEHEMATNCYRYSLEKNPSQPEIYTALGQAYLLTGEIGEAFRYYFEALNIAPNNPEILQKAGSFLVLVGRLTDAKNALEKALSLGAKSALQSLLDLKIHEGDSQDIRDFIQKNKKSFYKNQADLTLVRAKFSLGEYRYVVEHLEKQNIQTLTPITKATHLNLLGSAYEKLNQYEKAFSCFMSQNTVKPVHYSRQDMEEMVDTIIANTHIMDVSTVHYKDVTEQEFSPLFIIGLPRSGTSLLEQALNTSEHVVAGGELLFVEAAYKKYFDKHENLEDISQWYREKIEFITKNQEIPKEAPRWLIDKLPSNFVNVGFIKKMIPDAKFLYCKRDPMDNGLSIYKQNFLSTHSYATRLEDIAHFTSIERRVMNSWMEQYPDDIMLVEYENLVANFDAVTQQVFEFTDLDWNEEVQYFYKNNHYCNTASFDQVRQPVSNKSVGFYKNYKQQLKPLNDELKKLNVI